MDFWRLVSPVLLTETLVTGDHNHGIPLAGMLLAILAAWNAQWQASAYYISVNVANDSFTDDRFFKPTSAEQAGLILGSTASTVVQRRSPVALAR